MLLILNREKIITAFNIYHNKGKSGDIPYNLVESVERDVNLTQD